MSHATSLFLLPYFCCLASGRPAHDSRASHTEDEVVSLLERYLTDTRDVEVEDSSNSPAEGEHAGQERCVYAPGRWNAYQVQNLFNTSCKQTY